MAGRVMTVAAGTTAIKEYAYLDQDDIVEAIFPASLLTIEFCAFYGCSGIKRIDLSHTRVTSIGENAFYDCASLTEVIFPDTLAHMGDSCFQYCPAITAADLSTTKLATLADHVFCDCTALSTANMPTTLTAVGYSSFEGCRSLTGFEFPNGLATIGDNAFNGCSALTALHLPASVDTVACGAFKDCTALQTVVMESIKVQFTPSDDDDDDHFSGCTSLTAISVPDPDHAMATWPHDWMFQYCTKQLPELLAEATPGMKLRHYWKPGAEGHALYLPSESKTVLTVLLVAARLMHRCQAAAHSPDGHEHDQLQVPLALSDLPDELWFCILSLIRRDELGCAIA